MTEQAVAPYVFISYSRQDRAQATALAERLRQADVRVWIDLRSIHGGTSWDGAIVDGITHCAVFVLLCLKYAEVAWRYPEGGGVVTVASRALHPFVGLLGGLFILVDYYLTIAISALSGVYYLGVLVGPLADQGIATAVTIGALIGLGILNVIGIRGAFRRPISSNPRPRRDRPSTGQPSQIAIGSFRNRLRPGPITPAPYASCLRFVS